MSLFVSLGVTENYKKNNEIFAVVKSIVKNNGICFAQRRLCLSVNTSLIYVTIPAFTNISHAFTVKYSKKSNQFLWNLVMMIFWKMPPWQSPKYQWVYQRCYLKKVPKRGICRTTLEMGVWHDGLIFKLKQNGVTSLVLTLFTSYVNKQGTTCGLKWLFFRISSNWICVYQGSVLGPLLFLIYKNDLEVNTQSKINCVVSTFILEKNRNSLLTTLCVILCCARSLISASE